jgi:hypothetical protein
MNGRERAYINQWCNLNLLAGFNPVYCGSRYYCYQVLDKASQTVVRIDDDYYVFDRASGSAIRRQLKLYRQHMKGGIF